MNWFKKRNKYVEFIAGGSSGYKEEWDWEKIRFIVLSILIIIILIKL